MAHRDFERITTLARELAGIVLRSDKKQMIQTRIGRRMRDENIETYAQYIDRVEGEVTGAEAQTFVNLITTNLTSFFREAHHFDHFKRSVLGPALAAGDERLRVWCAGCSTGEEAYSVALTMMSKEHQVPLDYRILGTDVDTRVLKLARRACYPTDRIANLPPEMKDGFLQQADDAVRLMPALQQRVTFGQLNLLETWPMAGPFDAIFCRNVLIYFSSAAKDELIQRFAAILKPGGVLYLGHSEAIMMPQSPFVSLGRTTYQRTN